jgi:hypothetical protein
MARVKVSPTQFVFKRVWARAVLQGPWLLPVTYKCQEEPTNRARVLFSRNAPKILSDSAELLRNVSKPSRLEGR